MFDSLNFNISDSGDSFSLAKRALIFVEGEHRDSAGREHSFPPERIKKFVDNTNKFIASGGRLPFQKDHQKTQDFNIGDVEGELYTKVITEDDLPNPKYKHLVGKVGVFVDNIIGRGKEVVDQISQGLIKTLSPGLDPRTESFIEISATPTPAIIGPALFSSEGGFVDSLIYFEAPQNPNTEDRSKKAFSFEELAEKNKDRSKLEAEYNELSQGLFSILSSIGEASDEELVAADINPVEASYDAIEFFLSNLELMFGLVDSEKEEPGAENRSESPAAGKQPYPIGKGPSDYKKPIGNVLEFKKEKKIIGFTLQ